MKSASAADYLHQTSLLRLLAVLALVLSAHVPTLPSWEVILLGAGLGWRALASLRQWPLPRPWLRSVIVLLVFAGVFASYGRINGQQPGTALLVAMAVMKVLEMRSRRDVMVTVFLMYFILLTHFLHSQEMWTAIYLLVCAVTITALLVDVNHPGQALPLRRSVEIGGRMVALSVPLALVFFVLFPRIPGPLWGLPVDAGGGGASRSGMSSEMAPGDISEMILSERTAFRVSFLDTVPPPRQRYWRGPVLDQFDGRAWKGSAMSQGIRKPEARLESSAISYQVIMEPHRGPWLFALDLPDPGLLPPKTFIASEYQMMRGGNVNETLLYKLRSHTRYVLQAELPPMVRRVNLGLPKGFNPQAAELARQLREQHGEPEAIVQAVLQKFRKEKFVYTLRPPRLGRDSVDDFLFRTQRGFCEHYSSSFTYLMRAAGIPARVVTGYQGGEQNLLGDYYTVRDADAHAWSEVWYEGRGWVRIDPTSAVAPNRIERGISEALGADEGLPDFLDRSGGASLRIRLQAQWDWLDSQWNRWVLGYGPELQQEFLQRFGIRDWSGMILALTVIATTLLSVIGLLLLRQFAPARNEDLAVRLWHRAQRRLLKAGIAQRPTEGVRDFAERVSLEHPEFASTVQRAADAYLKLRYLEGESPALQAELTQAVKAIRA
ncbi:MAG TPA: DUF3488 and transglutaminase-like domain-containing protein [Solimonas sp.]|nr:DUF3488 and transglutaminase-like domain-containing protein [Solimonas sp.]